GTTSQADDRWGDYGAMSVDPVDDHTFWFTSEYMPGANFGTRIASFAFDDADPVVYGTAAADTITVKLNAANIEVRFGGTLVKTYDKAGTNTLTIHGMGGGDTITVDTSGGDPTPTGGLRLIGDADNDTIAGGPGNDFIDGGAGADQLDGSGGD